MIVCVWFWHGWQTISGCLRYVCMIHQIVVHLFIWWFSQTLHQFVDRNHINFFIWCCYLLAGKVDFALTSILFIYPAPILCSLNPIVYNDLMWFKPTLFRPHFWKFLLLLLRTSMNEFWRKPANVTRCTCWSLQLPAAFKCIVFVPLDAPSYWKHT